MKDEIRIPTGVEVVEEDKVGTICRNQGWVELHGYFTLPELEGIVLKIKEKNTRKPNVDQG